MVKRLAIGLVGVLILLSISMIAISERGEVVVIRSTSGDRVDTTRIWVVDVPEGMLVRGSAGKGWVDAARAATRVELERDGVGHVVRVVAQPGDAARERVNRRMRDKYGLADRLIGLLRDYESAVPLLLVRFQGSESPDRAARRTIDQPISLDGAIPSAPR